MPEAVDYEMSIPVIVYPAKTLHEHGDSRRRGVGFHAMFKQNRFRISGFGKTKEEAVLSLQERFKVLLDKGFVI